MHPIRIQQEKPRQSSEGYAWLVQSIRDNKTGKPLRKKLLYWGRLEKKELKMRVAAHNKAVKNSNAWAAEAELEEIKQLKVELTASRNSHQPRYANRQRRL